MSKSKKAFNGVIKILNDGRGLINHLNNKQDRILVSKSHLKGALDQDKIEYLVQTLHRYPYKKAKVVQIIRRSKNIFVGRIYNQNKNSYLSIFPHQSKKIKLVNLTDSLAELTVVEVEIFDWNEHGVDAKGKLIKVISHPNDTLADHLYIKNKYLTRSKIFDKHQIPINFDLEQYISKQNHREDFSDLNTFSIDPKGAQDFDDAISIKIDNNIYDLKIHIADVSEFVKEGTPLDVTALQNGNSYYFPEKSYHMLPSDLATKYCSLIPGEKRLAVSVCFKLNKSCDIISQRICLSIIKNKHRLNYDEVNDILINGIKTSLDNDIQLLYDVHNVLKKRRLKNGALNLLNIESVFNFNSNGIPIKIFEKKQSVSHSMVEECMLLANEFAANFLESKSYPIFRNHELPSRKSFIEIESLISAFSNRPMSINVFIRSFKSSKKQKVFSKLILKKLKKAEYSHTNKGHYGLSCNNYIHFTSPIRRYADLYCHRLLKRILKNKKKSEELNPIEKIVMRINQSEVKAKNAENEYNKLKKLKYIEANNQKTLVCTVEGFVKKYILVNINDANLTAVLSKSHLKHDRYRSARNRYAIVGQFSRKTIKVGDELKACVENVDMINQEVFLRFPKKRK